MQPQLYLLILIAFHHKIENCYRLNCQQVLKLARVLPKYAGPKVTLPITALGRMCHDTLNHECVTFATDHDTWLCHANQATLKYFAHGHTVTTFIGSHIHGLGSTGLQPLRGFVSVFHHSFLHNLA